MRFLGYVILPLFLLWIGGSASLPWWLVPGLMILDLLWHVLFGQDDEDTTSGS